MGAASEGERVAGEVRVGARALRAVVARAVRQAYRGAALAGPPQVDARPEGLDVAVLVRLPWGAPLERAAEQLRAGVRAALERALGQPVARVVVQIAALRRER